MIPWLSNLQLSHILSVLYTAIWSNLTDSKCFTACSLLIMIYIKNLIYFKGMLIIHLYRKLHFSRLNSPLDNTVKVKAILKFLTASSFVFQTKKILKQIFQCLHHDSGLYIKWCTCYFHFIRSWYCCVLLLIVGN
jgi:hypothetical protein